MNGLKFGVKRRQLNAGKVTRTKIQEIIGMLLKNSVPRSSASSQA